MQGLATYYDSDQEDNDGPLGSTKKSGYNDSLLKPNAGTLPDNRKGGKAPVVIKRPTRPPAHLRAHPIADAPKPLKPTRPAPSEAHRPALNPPSQSEVPDELSQIRSLLFPPGLDSVTNWGIPPPPNVEPDPQLQAKLEQFKRLKLDPAHPRHFNDELMANRTFRNPHLYAKLVEHVDVDERATNFSRARWDPTAVRPEWFADRIAERQKTVYEQQSQAQTSSKRSRIDFAPSSSKQPRSGHDGERDPHAGPRTGQPYGANDVGRDNKKGRWG